MRFRLAAALLFVAFPATAHHSTAIYDPERDVTLEGAVTAFHWVSPHWDVWHRRRPETVPKADMSPEPGDRKFESPMSQADKERSASLFRYMVAIPGRDVVVAGF